MHGRTPERLHGDDGVIMVLVAVSVAALVIVAALVFDGGRAYTQRRQVQNGADAAAMAGARALDRARFSGGAATAVDAAVQSVAADNEATSATCTVITSTGGTVGPCSIASNVTNSTAAGVRVRLSQTRHTTFGALAGMSAVTARTSAAATIQPLAGTRSPFLLCGNGQNDGYDILNSDGTINTAKAVALGDIPLQASQIPTCGAGSAFKGKSGTDSVAMAPGWVDGDNGNGFSADILDVVLNATPCTTDDFDDCDILVPVADTGTGNGNSIHMHVVAWAVFHVYGDGQGNPKYWGHFVADHALISSGRTTDGTVTDRSTPRVIKLYE
jgi:Flp pilus assembly protein TadG